MCDCPRYSYEIKPELAYPGRVPYHVFMNGFTCGCRFDIVAFDVTEETDLAIKFQCCCRLNWHYICGLLTRELILCQLIVSNKCFGSCLSKQ
jgi:hypothetical protein